MRHAACLTLCILCMYINVYTRRCRRRHTQTHTHTHTHTYIHIYVYVSLFLCLSLYMYLHVYICIRMHFCVSLRPSIPSFLYPLYACLLEVLSFFLCLSPSLPGLCRSPFLCFQGNDVFSCMLGKPMVYTCGIFHEIPNFASDAHKVYYIVYLYIYSYTCTRVCVCIHLHINYILNSRLILTSSYCIYTHKYRHIHTHVCTQYTQIYTCICTYSTCIWVFAY